jgi:hypothetical protein
MTIMASPVRYIMPDRVICIYFLKRGEKENIRTVTKTGMVIPKRINQKMLFSSGSSIASRKAKAEKKIIARISENLKGFSERLK